VNTEFLTRPRLAVPLEGRIKVLLDEYRALNQLLIFRLTAMERRVPTLGGALGVILGSIPVLPPEPQAISLVGLPATTAWFLLTTVSHARAKEDLLRRIDEIERSVNGIAGEELLAFQSRHPGRFASVSGRGGATAILAVFSACLLLLFGCSVLFQNIGHPLSEFSKLYEAYLAATAIAMAISIVGLSRYGYTKASPQPPPLALVLGRPTPTGRPSNFGK
jgi:hypothetical protein